MANTILHKKSSLTGVIPTTGQLALGEIAINTFDGKVYIKKTDGGDAVVEVGGGGATELSTDLSPVLGGNLVTTGFYIGTNGSNKLEFLNAGTSNIQTTTAFEIISHGNTTIEPELPGVGNGFTTVVNGGTSTTGVGGLLNMAAGTGSTTGGQLLLRGGQGNGGAGGQTTLAGGASTDASGAGGTLTLNGGSASYGTGGSINITAGQGQQVGAGVSPGGNVVIKSGTTGSSGTGPDGDVTIQNNGGEAVIAITGDSADIAITGNISITGNSVAHIALVADATTARTLLLTDDGALITITNAAANTVTIPPNASVAFPIGTQILVEQGGAGQTTAVAGAGVTLQSAGGLLALASQYSTLTLIKKATDTWLVAGDLA